MILLGARELWRPSLNALADSGAEHFGWPGGQARPRRHALPLGNVLTFTQDNGPHGDVRAAAKLRSMTPSSSSRRQGQPDPKRSRPQLATLAAKQGFSAEAAQALCNALMAGGDRGPKSLRKGNIS